jgi:hypothetical protein
MFGMYTYNKWVLTNDKSIPSKSEETFSLTHCGGTLFGREKMAAFIWHMLTLCISMGDGWYRGTVRWQTLAQVTFILRFHIAWYLHMIVKRC